MLVLVILRIVALFPSRAEQQAGIKRHFNRLGRMFASPKKRRYNRHKRELFERICHLLGRGVEVLEVDAHGAKLVGRVGPGPLPR